jgi:uncharacterized protein YcbK (DUF882 family)
MKDFWKDIEYFTPEEMGDPTGEHMDEDFMGILESLRVEIKRPLTITSGYRTPEHNKAIGGTVGSYHVRGKAADIRISSIKEGIEIIRTFEMVVDWYAHLWPNPMGGIGMSWSKPKGEIGHGFVHVDIGPRREWDYG